MSAASRTVVEIATSSLSLMTDESFAHKRPRIDQGQCVLQCMHTVVHVCRHDWGEMYAGG